MSTESPDVPLETKPEKKQTPIPQSKPKPGDEKNPPLTGRDRKIMKYIILLLILFYYIFQSFIAPAIRKMQADHTYDCTNAWDVNEPFDIKLYVTRTTNPRTPKDYRLLSSVDGVFYNSSLLGRTVLDFNYTLKISDQIKNNKTTPYFMIKASPSRCNFYDDLESNPPCLSIEQYIRMIRWIQVPIDKTHNLLTETAAEEPEGEIPFSPYLFENYTFDIVVDKGPQNSQLLYSHNYLYYRFLQSRNMFIPPVSEDTFWQLSTHRHYLNFTNETAVDIQVQVMLRSRFLWDLKLEYDQAETTEHTYMQKQWEDMKRAIIDTKPLLLTVTIVVSILHIIFNILAFTEDVSWWNSRKEMTGVSIRSLVVNIFSKAIILLFLLDVDTSNIVRAMQLIGLCVEIWKFWKALEPIMEFPYFRLKQSYKSSTEEFDSEGFKYLNFAMIPMLIIYAIYQLIKGKFKGIYSYCINVATGAVYAFGFLAMLPQIYVNYRLKSVAGMSGTVLAYKFTSTFIDDLFAFVMTMPMMHRIACFRDDIVFFVWLYQRHIYPTDNSRTNEYGETISEEDGEKDPEGEKLLEDIEKDEKDVVQPITEEAIDDVPHQKPSNQKDNPKKRKQKQ